MVCCIKRWQGRVDYLTPRDVYSSWWWCTCGSWRAEMMTRITDCSAGLVSAALKNGWAWA